MKTVTKATANSSTKPALKPVHAVAKADANAKMFAALAAAHKASLAKASGGTGATP